MTAETQDLKDAGLKITLPRLKILHALETSKVRHVSAEDVYRLLLDSGEEIGLATVYRVLTQFEDAGLVTGIILKVAIRSLSYRQRRTTITSYA